MSKHNAEISGKTIYETSPSGMEDLIRNIQEITLWCTL